MTAKYDYELVVIGAGSGGLAAAKQAAKLGKRVAIAEKSKIGGTCVNRGCIPTKLMIYAAQFAKQQKVAGNYGWINPKGLFDWPDFKQAMDDYIESLRKSQTENLNGVEILRGQATFVDSHTLQIDKTTITTKFVLIAVGSRPLMPDIPGIEHALTSRDIFQLDKLPESFLIVGGGYIGVEFSQVLHSFGCRVTLVDSNPNVLNSFDHDIQKRVKQILIDDHVRIVDQARLKEIEKGTGTLIASLDNGWSLKAQQILCALEREANIDTLNLDAVNVTHRKNKIVVNAQGQTQESNIFAVGDCTDRLLLTPVAKAEATVAIKAMFSDKTPEVDYFWIPSAVFMHPEVATAGLTEDAARKRYGPIKVHCSAFTPLKYAMTPDSSEAFIKLIFKPKSDLIVGIHLVSPRAADIIQALVPALEKGLTKEELDNTIGIHPSVGEEIFAL